MVLVYTARSSIERDALSTYFSEFKLPAKIVPKSREYSEIIAGTSDSIFDFYVEDTQKELAKEIIKSFQLQHEDKIPTKRSSPVKVGSIIILTVIGMIGIPLIFNIISTYLLGQYMQQKESANNKAAAVLFVVIGWAFVAIHIDTWLSGWLLRILK